MFGELFIEIDVDGPGNVAGREVISAIRLIQAIPHIENVHRVLAGEQGGKVKRRNCDSHDFILHPPSRRRATLPE